MLCRVLRTKQAKHVRRSAPIFTSIILDAQEKSAKRKRAGFFAASCGCVAEPRPADETGEAQRKRGASSGRYSRAGVGAAVQIYERAATRDGNLANSNQRGRGLNFQAHCMRAGNSGHRNPDGTARIANHNRGYRAQKLASPKVCRHGTPERPRRKSGAVFVPGHGPGPGSASARSSRRYAEGCEGEYLICQ